MGVYRLMIPLLDVVIAHSAHERDVLYLMYPKEVLVMDLSADQVGQWLARIGQLFIRRLVNYHIKHNGIVIILLWGSYTILYHYLLYYTIVYNNILYSTLLICFRPWLRFTMSVAVRCSAIW